MDTISKKAISVYKEAQENVNGPMYPNWQKGAKLLASAACLGYPNAASECILFSIKRRIKHDTIVSYYERFIACGLELSPEAQEAYDVFFAKYQARVALRKEREAEITKKEKERHIEKRRNYKRERYGKLLKIIKGYRNNKEWNFVELYCLSGMTHDQIQRELDELSSSRKISVRYIGTNTINKHVTIDVKGGTNYPWASIAWHVHNLRDKSFCLKPLLILFFIVSLLSMIYSIILGVLLFITLVLILLVFAKGSRNKKYKYVQRYIQEICKYTGLKKLEDYEVTSYESNEGIIMGDIYISLILKISERTGKELMASGKLPISLYINGYIDINGSIDTLNYQYMTT